MPWGFFFSVWFQTDICWTSEYLVETNIPNNTLYVSVQQSSCTQHVLSVSPFSLDIGHKTWSIV